MKKKSKSKSPIQIIAAIGLVIAILWTAKGFFEFGKAGYKEVKNKTSQNSSSGEYPILKCTIIESGERIVKVYDLNNDVVEENIKIDNNYIQWSIVMAIEGKLVIVEHNTDRRTGSYSAEFREYEDGKETLVATLKGKCEAGSNEKLF